MNILRCCKNKPAFVVAYKIGSKFYVCESCLTLDHWSRGIESKEALK